MDEDNDSQALKSVQNYQNTLVQWLRHKEYKWRDTARKGIGPAAEAASFYAAAYSNAADGIASGKPEKWVKTEELVLASAKRKASENAP